VLLPQLCLTLNISLKLCSAADDKTEAKYEMAKLQCNSGVCLNDKEKQRQAVEICDMKHLTADIHVLEKLT
jgi:hypothetical protein